MSEGRAYAPHCDASILHSPGSCAHCDKYPDWQELRRIQSISYTDEDYSLEKAPCPSTWFRSPAVRDLWPGNTPRGYEG